MYLLKTLAVFVAVLFTVSLAAPAPEISSTAGQAPPAASNVPVPDFSTPTNDPNPPPFIDIANDRECGESSFIGQTSAASPRVDDCLQIVTNIAGGGRWEVENFLGQQHQLVEWGTCAFGVQANHVGSPFFYVGNEDIIDVINTSIQKFSWNGLVGAKGFMWCNPLTLSPGTDWGLYHTKSFQPRDALNDTVPDLPAPTNDTSPITDFATPTNDTHPAVFSAGNMVNKCGESTFWDENSAASPKIDDCLVIVKNIAGGGRWEVEAFLDQQHQLVQWGTCAFGVTGVRGVRGTTDDDFFYVGNEDIIDLIHVSINKFGSNGLVGAAGRMWCSAALHPPLVEWSVYHTSQSRLSRDAPSLPDSNTTAPSASNTTAPSASNTTAPCPVFSSTPANDTCPAVFLAGDGPDNECGESTFENHNSGASPLIEDCLRIASNIAAGGKWEVESTAKDQHQLAQYGTCAFGVEGMDGLAFYFYVGNQDIIDLINVSVRQFGFQGRVGAAGEMPCYCPGSRPPTVGWGVYHT
jgi:hypothetical protein